MPEGTFNVRTRAQLLENARLELVNALEASGKDLDQKVRDMSAEELDQVYGELDTLRDQLTRSIEAVCVRLRAIRAVDSLEAKLVDATPAERAVVEGLLQERAAEVAELQVGTTKP